MSSPEFTVRLDNFEGPFDLLLQLISRRKLDITEIALSKVTDEFIAITKVGGKVWDLEQTSNFLLVAATLLDLKAARLLPSGEVEDTEDLALLEARDLLFARLLQYRAFQQVSAWLEDTLAAQRGWLPRPGGLEPEFAALMPELELDISVDELAALARDALAEKVPETVGLEHLHAPAVSVREQADWIVDQLRFQRRATFIELTRGEERLTIVARFLALLELYREKAVALDQDTPLGELVIRWTGAESGDIAVEDDYDQPQEEQ